MNWLATLFSSIFWLCCLLFFFQECLDCVFLWDDMWELRSGFNTCKAYRCHDLIKSITSHVAQWNLNRIVNVCFKDERLNCLRLAWIWVLCLHSIKLNFQSERNSIVKSETAFSLAFKVEVSSQNREWRCRVNLYVSSDATIIIIIHWLSAMQTLKLRSTKKNKLSVTWLWADYDDVESGEKTRSFEFKENRVKSAKMNQISVTLVLSMSVNLWNMI